MTRSLCHAATLPLCLLVFAACGGGGKTATASKPTMRDSAGVTIVENTAPVWRDGAGWTLTPKPTASIGVLDGAAEYQLFQVSGVVRLSDGTIVVANGGTKQLRFYDASGKFLKSVGREGGGPGEFKQLGGAYLLPGDTIATFDWNLRRVSLFTPTGDFVRSFLLTLPGNAGFLSPIGAFADGDLLVRKGTVFMTGKVTSGAGRDSTSVYVADTVGALVDTVGTFVGDERLVVADKTSMGVTSLAFGRQSFVGVRDSSVVFGANDTYAFEFLDRVGHVLRIVRRPHGPVPVTDADISAYKDQQLAAATDDNWRRFEERMLAKMPFPKTMPAYNALRVDALGNVWVQEYTAPGDSSNVWTVFNREGWMLGPVTLPHGFQVRDIGADYVLGLWKDENDVEHVMEYGLRKPEAQGKEGA